MRQIGCAVALLAGLAMPATAQGARAWDPPVRLSDPAADAWVGKLVPSMATSPAGGAVTAWRERADDGWSVKVVTTPLDGVTTAPQTLGGGRNMPSVAVDSLGNAIVAWVGSNDSPSDIEDGVWVSEGQIGGTFSAPRRIGGPAQQYEQPGTAVAINDRGEAVVIYGSGYWNDQRLWSVRRDAEGEWQQPELITGPLGEAVWRLHAGMSITGEAVFAWLSWHTQNDNSAWTAIQAPGGEIVDVRRMQSPGTRGTMPSLAVDRLGNAIVSWTELPADESFIVGDVRAAVRAPDQPFGEAFDLGGQAFDLEPSVAGLGADGNAVVAWQSGRQNGPYGGSLGGIVTAAGSVPAGVFTKPQLVSSNLVDTPLTLAVDPLGNAALFFVDWDTGEQRVVRRAVSGLVGQERAVGSCPRTRAYPLTAGVDALGNAFSLWTDTRKNAGAWLSRDAASVEFSPDPCPPPPPPFTWSPKDPAPGDRVTLNASGYVDEDAIETTFKWDLDNDGVYEITGSEPTVQATLNGTGNHVITWQVKNVTSPGNSWTGTYQNVVRTGTPPQPPNEYPTYYADSAPPNTPDESPWPVTPPVDEPPVVDDPPVIDPPVIDPPLPPAPVVVADDSRSGGVVERSPAPSAVFPPPPATPTLQPPP